MDNRFGFKDFVLVVLMLGGIGSIFLAMKQYQRHWEVLRDIRSTLEEQTGELASLQRTMQEGVRVQQRAGATENEGGAGDPENDPFQRVRQAKQNEVFARGDWVIDSFGSNIDALTPLVSSDTYSRRIQDLVLESLGQLNLETLEYEPLLARRWELEDNSDQYQAWREAEGEKLRAKAEEDPSVFEEQLKRVLKGMEAATGQPVEEGSDRYEVAVGQAKEQWVESRLGEHPDRPTAMRITFWLRDGLTFSDGEPLTAADVAFSYEMIMNPKVAAPRQRSYFSRTVEDVEAVSEQKVVFHFKRPYFEALRIAAGMNVLPKHYYQPIIEENPEKFNQAQSMLIGSGPYKLRSIGDWSPGEDVVLVRNNRYWGEPAPLSRAIFKIYTEDIAELTAFRNNDTDMFSPSPEQFDQLMEDEALVEKTEQFNYMTPFNGYRFIAWNQEDQNGEPTQFADKRVRQALTMLTDRERLLKEVHRGYGQVATGPFNPLGQQSNPEVEPWPHDVERARSLLREVGYEDRDNDGVIENEAGQEFSFELTFPANSPAYKKMVMMLKDAYAKAGIDLEPDPLEWSVMTERLNNRNFEAITLGWSSGPETDINQMFHSEQIRPGGDNFMAYRSDALDEAIDTARFMVDEEARMKVWHRAHEILHEDQPYTFLFWGESLRFVDDRYKNLHIFEAGLNPRSEWYVPEPAQRWSE